MEEGEGLDTRLLSSGFVVHGTTSSSGDRCDKPVNEPVTAYAFAHAAFDLL